MKSVWLQVGLNHDIFEVAAELISLALPEMSALEVRFPWVSPKEVAAMAEQNGGLVVWRASHRSVGMFIDVDAQCINISDIPSTPPVLELLKSLKRPRREGNIVKIADFKSRPKP